MDKKLIYHHNLIGHEINESLEFFADDVLDREIYCRKKHLVTEPLESDCKSCPCFAGLEQGHGRECAWGDVTTEEYVVKHEERYKEYERVDKLIKLGILETVSDIPAFNVKMLPYDDSRWIYEQSKDMENRYLLGKRGEKTLVCCGVNPSTASPEDLDPTMKRVESLAKANGYDGYIMINLYPMRATDPNKMHEYMNVNIVEQNLEYIKNILSVGNADIWAAWGNLIEKREYLKECLMKIADIADTYMCTWYTMGTLTKGGHPRHPLYLSNECKKEEFKIHDYLEKLK